MNIQEKEHTFLCIKLLLYLFPVKVKNKIYWYIL